MSARRVGPRTAAWIGAGMLMVAAGCEREERRFREVPPAGTATSNVVMSAIEPGPVITTVRTDHPYDENAYAIAQGKRLFNQMNCAGCHSVGGGGGMGPPLMDDSWIYGSDPANIFSTIVEGRPNGMPAFRGKMGNDQIWQLVAYVRSLSALQRKDVRPGRNDDMSGPPDEMNRNRQRPRQSFQSPASEMTTP